MSGDCFDEFTERKMQTKKIGQEKNDYDSIVIGGGSAGISAALWCDELGLKTLLLESTQALGGQLLRVYNPIKNHLGIETNDGRELRDIFVRQIEKCRFDLRLESEITRIDLKNKTIRLVSGETFRARTLTVATGVRRRKLNVEGEDKFAGKGIIESGKREADSVKNKRVCVIGGGDAALENALILSETAAHVALVHRRADLRARREFVEQVRKNPKVEIFAETIVQEFTGGEHIATVGLKDLKTGRIFREDVEAALIRIGVEPNTDFLTGQLVLDEQNYIRVNQRCETSVEKVYAVGDAANPLAPTVSTAVGTGATAAKAIRAQLNSESDL